MAGTDTGTTIVLKTRKSDAPSMRAASIMSGGRVMKKLRNRKIPKGSANAVCASQIATNPRVSWRSGRKSRDVVRSGMKATWTGTRRNATTMRNSVSRKGNLTHEKAYAASAQIAIGSSVEGTAMKIVFTKDS